ncbi:DUF4956 domain-containing protein [Proteocatella sphenisci]|uniref:DUF4956 domain-containing protein n=1 Tax=Proteocatella sphenisci TaxID=181070 RepID=UPI00048DBF93|nr:DUF4956 domain-containing protein [Proteocatella sphenisci]
MKEQILNLLVTNTAALTLEDILLNFLVAGILSMVIYMSYALSHAGPVYSARFNVSLVMMTLVTTLVMNVIGNNIALSLGMVGALSVVRFRTAIKDPRDTAYIFWGIAVGICCGVMEYIIATVGSIVIFLFLIIFGFVKANDRYLLIVRGERPSSTDIKKTVDRVYNGKASLRVENSTEKTVEFIYELSMSLVNKAKKKNMDVTEELYKVQGISNVNLVCQNDEINR